jgi:hypothetical protein
VGRDRAESSSTSAIFRAGVAGAPAATSRDPLPTRGAARATGVSGMVPNAWHCGHCPTHLVTSRPHSVQRNSGRFEVRLEATGGRAVRGQFFSPRTASGPVG